MLVATLEGPVTVVLIMGTFIIYFFGGVFFMILMGDFRTAETGCDTSGMI
jgi:hypothetical protein